MTADIEIFRIAPDNKLVLPFIGNLSAGFPSPAMDFMEECIDLGAELVKHPATTFYGRVSGHSLKDAELNDGDILVIDRSLKPVHNDIAVVCIDDEFTIKIIQVKEDGVWLMPANKKYQPRKVTEFNNFTVWGIVTYVVKKKRTCTR
jgi:DNA polymerase V